MGYFIDLVKNNSLNENIYIDDILAEPEEFDSRVIADGKKPIAVQQFQSLVDVIWYRYKKNKNCNLNDVDVREIYNFKYLFSNKQKFTISIGEDKGKKVNFKDFNGDISKWDTQYAHTFEGMFEGNKKFNGDISKWNLKLADNIAYMFKNSNFNNKTPFETQLMGCLALHKDVFKGCPLEKKFGANGEGIFDSDLQKKLFDKVHKAFYGY